ncbi:hypothetical protein BJ912DRAFT_1091534 [Pholiota molesta]|nr:hypothetical protein BJ912DRAFT_1091534 [Pholiota molesta]
MSAAHRPQSGSTCGHIHRHSNTLPPKANAGKEGWQWWVDDPSRRGADVDRKDDPKPSGQNPNARQYVPQEDNAGERYLQWRVVHVPNPDRGRYGAGVGTAHEGAQDPLLSLSSNINADDAIDPDKYGRGIENGVRRALGNPERGKSLRPPTGRMHPSNRRRRTPGIAGSQSTTVRLAHTALLVTHTKTKAFRPPSDSARQPSPRRRYQPISRTRHAPTDLGQSAETKHGRDPVHLRGKRRMALVLEGEHGGNKEAGKRESGEWGREGELEDASRTLELRSTKKQAIDGIYGLHTRSGGEMAIELYDEIAAIRTPKKPNLHGLQTQIRPAHGLCTIHSSSRLLSFAGSMAQWLDTASSSLLAESSVTEDRALHLFRSGCRNTTAPPRIHPLPMLASSINIPDSLMLAMEERTILGLDDAVVQFAALSADRYPGGHLICSFLASGPRFLVFVCGFPNPNVYPSSGFWIGTAAGTFLTRNHVRPLACLHDLNIPSIALFALSS